MTLNEKSILDDDSIRACSNSTKCNRPLYGASLVGHTVLTTYGQGVVQDCRQDEDGWVYVIQLTSQGNDPNSPSFGILYTRELPIPIKTPAEEAQELNVACEAHEKMRRMNLELLFHEQGIVDIDHDQCTTCLLSGKSTTDRQRFPRLQRIVDTACETAVSATAVVQKVSTTKPNFSRLRKLLNKAETNQVSNDAPALPDQGQTTTSAALNNNSESLPTNMHPLKDQRFKLSGKPCLICGNPVCSEHSSTSFRKEGITLCLGCERLFELDFIVECVSTSDAMERSKRIDHMVDCYDRCLLLLKYATQYADQIAQSLEEQKHKQNKIGLGSSGVGVLSGMLGIAAAATILTPTGPPLLIASLFFGGSATVVQTGSEALNYFSEPNCLADRIIALHGMLLSILRVTSTLRDAMMRDHIRTDALDTSMANLKVTVTEALVANRTGVVAASNVGRAATLGSVAGAETAAGMGARSATALSRASAAAARTVRFARFAGGALSAAVLVMEANAIQGTLKEIRSGSPCDKANRIRAIKEEIRTGDLPSTAELDEECQAYLSALASRRLPLPEVSAVAVTAQVCEQYSQAECSRVPMSVIPEDYDRFEGSLILREDDTLVIPQATATTVEPIPQNQPSLFGSMGSSLLRRIPLLSSHDTTRMDDAFTEALPLSRMQLGESELDLVL